MVVKQPREEGRCTVVIARWLDTYDVQVGKRILTSHHGSTASKYLSDGRWLIMCCHTALLLCVCAGSPCRGRHTPGVMWTANWASDKMQVDTERHMLLDKVTTLDAASAYPIDETSVDILESLGLHRAMPEAIFHVQMRRHHGIRAVQLLVALSQLGFIAYCLMMGAGQVLWAYAMARFLCVRTHMMTRSRRTTID